MLCTQRSCEPSITEHTLGKTHQWLPLFFSFFMRSNITLLEEGGMWGQYLVNITLHLIRIRMEPLANTFSLPTDHIITLCLPLARAGELVLAVFAGGAFFS